MERREMLLLTVLIVGGCLLGTNALNNGLALTPPMGWLSWERFRCETDCKKFPNSCVDENLYMAVADMMVADGYKDAGYEYVHIDDCWAAQTRDSSGKIQPNADRFPHGMKALADYVHKRGLKLGIYTDIGTATCTGLPGSGGHFEDDANTFAQWGIDLVKTDGCHANGKDMDTTYPLFGAYLNKTGRPIVYCCSWPAAQIVLFHMKPNYTSVQEHCNVWRNYLDVQDSWDNVKGIFNFYGENQLNFASFSGPGGFSDPDQLVVGDFGLSYTQQKAQFGMWAMLASPLFMSVDLRTISPTAKAILLNKHVIAISQDPLGAQATRVKDGTVSVWLKPLASKGSYAIALLNVDDQGRPSPYSVNLDQLGLRHSAGYNVTNIYENVHMGMYKPASYINVLVDPTGILMIKAVPL